jgi:hypothetical protein
MTALFSSGILGSLTPPAPTALVQFRTDEVEATQPVIPSATTAASATVTATAAVTATSPAATPTAPPTSTAVPPVNTPVSRGGELVRAQYLSDPPTLDGNWDDWDNAAYPATYITYGYDKWVGSNDLEGSFRVGWDEDYLYLAVKAIDDVYVQNASGENIFQGDSVEILLDRDLYGDFYSKQLSGDDYQLGISPGNPDVNGTREAYLWYPSAQAGGRSGVQIASTQSDGLYRVEAFIPWSIFGVTPASGSRYGFVLSISDNDLSGTKLQESLASSVLGRRFLDPTTWGELILVK